MRLFIGVAPDAAARDALAASIGAWRRTLGDLDTALRWVPAANLHATLHFLGDVQDDRLAGLRAVLAPPIDVRSFDVAATEFGRFPARGPIATLWIGLRDGGGELVAVHAAIGDRLTAAGVIVERRPFTAHVTIARARDRDRRRLRALRWPPAVAAPEARWRVTHATLFQSTLSAGAPVYVPVQLVALQ
jgi:2'-5' RNA ligase